MTDDDEDISLCVACGIALKDGDEYFPDINNGGELHAGCCGPDRECYTDEEGDPLADSDPIPSPSIWRPLVRSAPAVTNGDQ